MSTYPRPLTMRARIYALKAQGRDSNEIAEIVGRTRNYVSTVLSGFRADALTPTRPELVSAAELRARRAYVEQRKAAFRRAASIERGHANGR